MTEIATEVNQEAKMGLNLEKTIPLSDSTSKGGTTDMPTIKRRSEGIRSKNIGIRITPRVYELLDEISRRENASRNSIIAWLIETEARKRGL